MIYIIVAIVVVIAVVLFLRQSQRARSRDAIDLLRVEWGKPKKGPFNFDSIGRYAEIGKVNVFHQLSLQTLQDIDFYELFAFVDRTTSKMGQQFLFDRLLRPTNSVDERMEQNVELFTRNQSLREEVQGELIKLNSSTAYSITSLLRDRSLIRPTWFSLAIISAIVLAAMLVLAFVYPVFLIFMVIPVTANMLIHYWNRINTLSFAASFSQLSLLIDVSSKIEEKDILFENNLVKQSVAALRPFQWKMKLLAGTSEVGIKDELGQIPAYFIEILKGFFLIEFFTLFQLVEELEAKKETIRSLFNYTGSIDMAISVASLRAGSLKTCRPDFHTLEKEILVRKVYHPLIKDCAKNDLSIKGKSILITGSNMSGKTTFLRTFAINSILAQTINTCFADEFKSPMFKQFSSIRIDDNLFEGKSYFFEEVNMIASFIREVEPTNQNLFILDEVFKGTNTRERIASATAVLSYLNRNANVVMVSTHDIELANLLKEEYDLYHFTDTIVNNQLFFDHKIKEGQLTTRNAIRILEISDYPADIIKEANRLSEQLGERNG